MSAGTIPETVSSYFLGLQPIVDVVQNKVQIATRHRKDLQTLVTIIEMTLDDAKNKVKELRMEEPKKHLDCLHELVKKILEFVCMSESRSVFSSWWFWDTDAATIEGYRKQLDDWRKDFRCEASWMYLTASGQNKTDCARTTSARVSDMDPVRIVTPSHIRFDASTSLNRSVISRSTVNGLGMHQQNITINGPGVQYHVHYHGIGGGRVQEPLENAEVDD
ncbi:hypothetical protein K435DRAFT_878215 [Dendrothele bispora CBS 962.96]|uniref:Uncharacterized protein n=1 Tax=Dendrothele bispora (strain CBS 962.96) TaxID=1314807 RepID=A0A4S8KNP6_DENBC|nr:hypothetical protein K435DRAFT_878215 [Dendrothele bispora CBS 962.96]